VAAALGIGAAWADEPTTAKPSSESDPDWEVWLAEEAALEEEFGRWDHDLDLRLGGGHKDNVGLGHTVREASPFVAGGADWTFLSPLLSPTRFLLLVSGDLRTYLDAKTTDREALLMAQAELSRSWGETWQGALRVQYSYLDQVYDVSATEAEYSTLPVRVHALAVRPSVRCDLGKRWWLELEPQAARSIVRQPLDNYWEAGPRLTLGRSIGRQTELRFSYAYAYRPYDARPQRDAAGSTLAGTSLAFARQRIEARLERYWGDRRRWRSSLTYHYEANRDNGPGYFDFDRHGAGPSLRYRSQDWEISAYARAYSYDYAVQRASLTDASSRSRFELTCGVRVEAGLVGRLKGYLEYERDQTWSNQELDAYDANTVMAGLAYGF